MIEAIKEAVRYGLGGVSLLGVIWLLYLFYKLERRMFTHEKETQDNQEVYDKHSKYFKDTFIRLDKVEKKNVKSDGRFDKIDSQLKTIGENVTKIVDHFVTKGMQ